MSVILNRQWAEQAFAGTGTTVPFSFVYDGQHSSAFLSGWKHEVRDERIDATQRRHILTFTDPQTGLEVRAVTTIYLDTPGVDWTLHFTNTGPRSTPVLEQVKAVAVSMAPPGGSSPPVLHRLNGNTREYRDGSWFFTGDDWLPVDEPLPPGKRIDLAPIGGKPAQGIGPFFNLEWAGGGVITAIGWSGQWAATVEHTAEGRLHVQAGIQTLHLRLQPGETIRSPRILQLYWQGDHGESYNQFRHTMFAHILPRVNGELVVPPVAYLSTAFYEGHYATEAIILRHVRGAAGLGFEYFWVDAHYFRGGFPNGVGHYGFPLERVLDLERLPRGLKPVSEAAHAAGMGFLLWFEPERVAPGTALAVEHPEWIVSLADGRSGLLNLGLPAAREYMTRYLIAAIREYGVDCLRIDFNIDPLPFWQLLDRQNPDRVGLAEIRYVEGHYRMWDEIRAAYPQLFIDNCASGGTRIDLETCARSIPLWRTDATIDPLWDFDFNQAALQNQVMTAGLSRYVPFSTSGMMGVMPYWFRSGFNAGTSYCEDVRSPSYPRDLLKQGIAEGKRIRQYFFGDFYPLNEVTVDPDAWTVLQYHRAVEGEGMVLAFRRHQAESSTFLCALHQIQDDAAYDVRFAYDYTPGEVVRMSGADLQHLQLEIAGCPGSLLVEYARVKA